MREGSREQGAGSGETRSPPATPGGRPPLAAGRSLLPILLEAARPKTLPAAAAPVALGSLFAWSLGGFHALAAACALAGALLIQIGTNYVNDAEDALRGADDAGRLGPRRATAAGLVSPAAMRRAAAGAFALAFVAGLYLVVRGGWPILAVGLASIASGVAYTAGRHALAYTGLADAFVLVFFGPVAVGGTVWVQALALPPWVVVAGVAPGALATAILVANNVRDAETDAVAGKRTLAVRFGRAFGLRLYTACISTAIAVPAAQAFYWRDHVGVLAASLVAALVGRRLAVRLAQSVAEPVPAGADHPANAVLAATGRLLFVYSALYGLGVALT